MQLVHYLQLLAEIIVALAMVPALAHALELPGKMRLSRVVYHKVQGIYYPGFTVAGCSEPLAVVAVVALLLFTPSSGVVFWLTSLALVALLGVQAVYWTAVHPVNKVWLEGDRLDSRSSVFFAFGRPVGSGANSADWTHLRNRWEYAHVVRAVLATVAFVLLLVANTLH